MGTQVTSDSDFNVLQFEKQLSTLKDSQESINACCQWCLQNRTHHKKIVNSWLNVLKRVKVEQRLILFYLANDVVQYSKRRHYEYVESWGTALQKATTLVRDERVKHKILRIFKIWEQRGVYGEEFISDLCGLISVTPSGPKNDEPHEFQATYVINKIKNCASLEKDTDTKLKILNEHNPKIQISETLITSLKDRAHVDDVEKEVDVYVKHMESYINALKIEIKNRIALISVLRQAETQLEADRKDVKLVAHAYKTFGTRVKTFQKRLEDHKATLPSPVPSPDINAPSPSPDSELELPDDEPIAPASDTTNTFNNTTVQYSNAGYYNPVTGLSNTNISTTEASSNYVSNGFTSFLGSSIPFDLQNLSSSMLFHSEVTEDSTQTTNSYTSAIPSVQPPLPVEAPASTNQTANNYAYTTSSHVALQPPPMPPFTKGDDGYSSVNYSTSAITNTTNSDFGGNDPAVNPAYDPTSIFDRSNSFNFDPPTTYPSGTEEYIPQDPNDWEHSSTWELAKDTDTPESPPMFEKEGYGDPVEYHDNSLQSGAVDVDQRVLPGMGDLEDSLSSLGGKDVDHRNLISLTGSPVDPNGNAPAVDTIWNQQIDQDYRGMPPQQESLPTPPAVQPQPGGDTDYRLAFNINLPPPPPPPPNKSPPVKSSVPPLPPNTMCPPPLLATQLPSKSPKKSDNVESIDMDLSDEDLKNFSLEPPPPLPDLPDDVDANQFLDDISNDISEFTNMSREVTPPAQPESNNMSWQHPPPLNAPPPNFTMAAPPPLLPTPLGPAPPMGNMMNPPPPMLPMPNWGMGGMEQLPPPPPWMQHGNPPGIPFGMMKDDDGPFGPPDDENPYLRDDDNPFLRDDDNQFLRDDDSLFMRDDESPFSREQFDFSNNFEFRGRDFRGNFNNRGRRRGNNRGGRGGGRRGGGFRQKGNFRGNRGGF